MLIGGWRGWSMRGARQRLDAILHRRGSTGEQHRAACRAGSFRPSASCAIPGRREGHRQGRVSLSCRAGESMGLIGPRAPPANRRCCVCCLASGRTRGTVRLDGADIASWPRSRLGKYIGYLPQDVARRHGGREHRAPGEPDVAGDRCCPARQRARDDPAPAAGLHAQIGEGGAALPAASASAFDWPARSYGKLRIVVPDEPNANLDGEGEMHWLWFAGLREAGVTLIVVSHRPSLLAGSTWRDAPNDGNMRCSPRTEVVLSRLTCGTVPMPGDANAPSDAEGLIMMQQPQSPCSRLGDIDGDDARRAICVGLPSSSSVSSSAAAGLRWRRLPRRHRRARSRST